MSPKFMNLINPRAMKHFIIFFNLLMIFSCVDTIQNKYEVFEIKVLKEHENSWALTGMVKNTTSVPKTLSVKIKFLDSNNNIRHTARAFVNDDDPLMPHQSGNFKYYTDPEDFSGIVDFQIIVVEY